MATGHACRGLKPKYPTTTVYNPALIARREIVCDILSNPNTSEENKLWRLSMLKPIEIDTRN